MLLRRASSKGGKGARALSRRNVALSPTDDERKKLSDILLCWRGSWSTLRDHEEMEAPHWLKKPSVKN